jgi:hypothetical protein
MAKVHDTNTGEYLFFCPGCNEAHKLNKTWEFNGDYERPTFKPSVLVRSGHYVSGYKSDKCWCTYDREHPNNPAPCKCVICHSFITDGKIQYLSDCTHELAGQTIDLPDF